MHSLARLTVCTATAAALVIGTGLSPRIAFAPKALAQNVHPYAAPHAKRSRTKPPQEEAAAAAQAPKLPPRAPFSAADDAAATIPGMPDARFWADSTADFEKALPAQPGPWLILSTGGSDGAFGAGILNGLSAAGHRPDYSVVTGVSTGALMAPFAFAGDKYDAVLKGVYTRITAADIFEIGATADSFLDTWPLRDLIAKEITPQLLTDIASAYKAGRRLFVVTTDLDAQRSVVWNMGAIAVHSADPANGAAAVDLFRKVLLASGSIPGAFPPVLIDVDGNGKRFAEMHVDGGVGGQFFVAPPALLASDSGYKIPATRLEIVINSGLQPDFQVVEQTTPSVLTQAVGMAVKVDLRLMLDRAFVAAKNSAIGFAVASIPANFSAPSRGAFDPDYMKALFEVGFAQGKSDTAFAAAPPAYAGPPASAPAVNSDSHPSAAAGETHSSGMEKSGATK